MIVNVHEKNNSQYWGTECLSFFSSLSSLHACLNFKLMLKPPSMVALKKVVSFEPHHMGIHSTLLKHNQSSSFADLMKAFECRIIHLLFALRTSSVIVGNSQPTRELGFLLNFEGCLPYLVYKSCRDNFPNDQLQWGFLCLLISNILPVSFQFLRHCDNECIVPFFRCDRLLLTSRKPTSQYIHINFLICLRLNWLPLYLSGAYNNTAVCNTVAYYENDLCCRMQSGEKMKKIIST